MKTSFFLGLATVIALSANSIYAEDEKEEIKMGWNNSLSSSFQMNQGQYRNWSEGGDNLVSATALLDGDFVYEWENMSLANAVKLGYGRTKIEKDPSRKSLDQIFLESMYKYRTGYYVNPYVSARLETQFTTGFEYPKEDSLPRYAISNFMDPGYITESVGIGIEPASFFKTRAGFALKQTFSEKYGWADDVETEAKVETFKNEPGLESISDLELKASDIVKYQSKLSIFANFKGTEQIDGKWENTLSAQIAKFVTVDFTTILLYDYDLSKDSQLRQGLGVGLTWKML
jgi:hypothetical protein